MIRFTIPLPPSTNALYRNVPGKGRVKTKKYYEWAQDAGWQALAAVPVAERVQIKGDVRVSIIAGPRNKRRDLDNMLKSAGDLLVSMQFIRDDSDIVDLSIKWGDVQGAEVTIESSNDNRAQEEKVA